MELLQNKKRDQMNLVAAMQSTLKPGAEQGYHSGGRWTYTGKTSFEGTVIEWSMKFHGGQAEGPSLGGSLRLDRQGKPRFRIMPPLRPLSKPKWQWLSPASLR